MMKTTKTGLRYYPKGSPEAKAHMARLRAMQGKKKPGVRPLAPEEATSVVRTMQKVFSEYDQFKRGVPELREALDCGTCGGLLVPMGKLGHLLHLRCRHCGMETFRQSNPVVSDPRGSYRMQSPVSVKPGSPGQALDVTQFSGPGGTMLAVARDVNPKRKRRRLVKCKRCGYYYTAGEGCTFCPGVRRNPPMLIMGNPDGWKGWRNVGTGFVKEIRAKGKLVWTGAGTTLQKSGPDYAILVLLDKGNVVDPWVWAVGTTDEGGFHQVAKGRSQTDEIARDRALIAYKNFSSRRKNPSPDYGGPAAQYVRHRQRSPLAFAKGSFRTIPLGRGGKKAVVGCPKGQWMPRRQRCRTGMRMQSILVPKRRLNPDGLPPRIANDPAFRRELREYRAIHGEGPVEVRVVTVPNGSPKYMTSWGHIPEIKYDAPTKKGRRIHHFGEHGGSKPYLVSSASRGPKYIGIVGGSVRIGRKRGSGPQKWLLR